MWLDDICRRELSSDTVNARLTLGGFSPAAETDSERRGLKLIRTGGALRLPVLGEKQLILACGDGEYAVLGKTDGTVPADMQEGEIYIETENAAVFLKNSGRILITGDVEILGSLSVNGRTIDGA